MILQFRYKLLLFYNTKFSLLLSLFFRFFKSKKVMSIFKKLKLDLRYVWEYERLYFLASNMDSRRKYMFLKFYYFITPLGRGVPFGCAMECTFRVFNLLYFVKNEPKYSKDIKKYVLREFNFIENNIELHSNNNHILFNYLTLVLVDEMYGVYDSKYNDTFLSTLSSQFNNDGSNFEGSTSYHLLVIEAISWLLYFKPVFFNLVQSAIDLSKSIDFINAFKNKNSVWLLGDNDSSICIKNFVNNNPKDVRALQLSNVFSNLSCVTQGSKNKQKMFFPDFGLMKYEERDYSLVFANIQSGQNGKAGHNHNDLLSICLSVFDNDVIIDPGVCTYSYKRNEYRSSQHHSGPYLIADEKNIVEPESYINNFAMSSCVKKIILHNDNFIQGEFYNPANELRLKRCLTLFKNRIDIVDTISTDSLTLGFSLIFSSDYQIKVNEGFVSICKDQKTVIGISISSNVNINTSLISYSPTYGKIKWGTRLSITSKNNNLVWSIKLP